MLIYPNLAAAIADAVAGMRRAERQIVHNFVREMLSGGYAPEEIERVWSGTPAQIGFSAPAGLTAVLRLMHDLTGIGPDQNPEPDV